MRQLHVTDYQMVTMDQQIVTYHGNVAACERLYSQPLPVAYLRHTSRWRPPLCSPCSSSYCSSCSCCFPAAEASVSPLLLLICCLAWGLRTALCGVARFLMTWLIFLPFALYHTFQWFTPAICGLVAFLLIGVEVGQRPFIICSLITAAKRLWCIH